LTVIIDYEDFLEKFCIKQETITKHPETLEFELPSSIRKRIKQLNKEGFLTRITLEWHYHSVKLGPKQAIEEGRGFGFVRIHKYKLHTDLETGIEIERGEIGNNGLLRMSTL